MRGAASRRVLAAWAFSTALLLAVAEVGRAVANGFGQLFDGTGVALPLPTTWALLAGTWLPAIALAPAAAGALLVSSGRVGNGLALALPWAILAALFAFATLAFGLPFYGG